MIRGMHFVLQYVCNRDTSAQLQGATLNVFRKNSLFLRYQPLSGIYLIASNLITRVNLELQQFNLKNI